jgi:hypothetical protein
MTCSVISAKKKILLPVSPDLAADLSFCAIAAITALG